MKLRHFQPVAATLVGLAVAAPITFDRSFDAMVDVFKLTLIAGLVMLAFLVALPFERPPARRMSLLALLCLPAAAFAMHLFGTLWPADRARWLIHREAYRQQMAMNATVRGEFQHMEWNEDSWGGLNFFDYVVFDPTDRLATIWQQSKDGRVPGLPCPAGYGLRFERGYYLISFRLPWGTCETSRAGTGATT